MASTVPVPKPGQSGVNEHRSYPVCTPDGGHLPNLHQELVGHSSASPTVARSSVLIQLTVSHLLGPQLRGLSGFTGISEKLGAQVILLLFPYIPG